MSIVCIIVRGCIRDVTKNGGLSAANFGDIYNEVLLLF